MKYPLSAPHPSLNIYTITGSFSYRVFFRKTAFPKLPHPNQICLAERLQRPKDISNFPQRGTVLLTQFPELITLIISIGDLHEGILTSAFLL